MEIRTASLADEEASVALWRAAGLTRPWVDASRDFVRGVECEQSDILLAVDEGRVIGSVLVADDGHRGWMYSVAVDAAARGAGLGARLVRAAEDWFRARGQAEIRLLVREENRGVLGFYRGIGYEEIGCLALGRTIE